MHFLNLVANEFWLHTIMIRRYWFEMLSTIVVMSCIFMGLFYGIKSFFSGSADSPSLDTLFFGYLMWNFAILSFSAASQSIIEDNQKGLIDQLYVCSSGFIRFMMARVISQMLWNIVLLTSVAYLSMLLTNNWLNINFFTLYCLLILSAPSLIGIGFIVCGLALLFKRVQTIIGILQVAFMGIVALDGTPFSAVSLLPFTMGASLAKEVVLQGQAINMTDLLGVLINSTTYLLIGISIYQLLESRAKKLNLIGQY